LRHFFCIEAIAVFPFALDLVHRKISVANQCAGVVAVLRIQADPYAGAGAQALGVDDVRCLQRMQDAPGSRHGKLGGRAVGQDYREFVAAEAAYAILRSYHRTQALRRFDQEGVSYLMAQAVINVLEVVQVDEEYADATLGRFTGLQALLQESLKLEAVGKAGEHVAACHVLEFLLPLRSEEHTSELQ